MPMEKNTYPKEGKKEWTLKISEKAWNSRPSTITTYINHFYLHGLQFLHLHMRYLPTSPVSPPTTPSLPLYITPSNSLVVPPTWHAFSCLHSFVDAILCLEWISSPSLPISQSTIIHSSECYQNLWYSNNVAISPPNSSGTLLWELLLEPFTGHKTNLLLWL